MQSSDRYWSGVWSDMSIETKFMRSFKTNTGLTRGRDISDSVISKWILEMSATHDICASLEVFCGVLFSSSDMIRITINISDIGKLAAWFDNDPPFPIMSEIMSIATGVVGDCTINKLLSSCHNWNAGDGENRRYPIFGIWNISSPTSSICRKVAKASGVLLSASANLFQKLVLDFPENEPIMLEPERACIQRKASARFCPNAAYTLPTEISCILAPVETNEVSLGIKRSDQEDAVPSICEAYVKYIKSDYPGRSCCFIFDGYTNSPNSTKAAEQEQWYRMKKSSDTNLSVITEIATTLSLSNGHNKIRLITILKSQPNENGIESRQAPGEAVLLIVTTAIDKSKPLDKSTVAVIGGDVELAVLLMANTTPYRDILVVKPARGKIKTDMTQLGLKDILFLHAFADCDTTSEAFRKSKVGFIIKLYQKNRDIQKAAEVLSKSTSTHTRVQEEGGNVS
ncbi:hypothetical protein PR048_030334 [Dryococelus australis]|uniref:VWFA domain-containing protein n=1 Tax=Dryococelus australis TaxID=614101 RepID=A0ABQ9G8N9_9NEOP|nr:hypothetical protein PR048_030334 [Dryococelus australis]